MKADTTIKNGKGKGTGKNTTKQGIISTDKPETSKKKEHIMKTRKSDAKNKAQSDEMLEQRAAKISTLIDEHRNTGALEVIQMHEIGLEMMSLKKDVNARKKGSWGKFMKQHYPSLPEWDYQRYMRIAKHVEMENHDKICQLGQERIFKLVRVAKKAECSLLELLKENDIPLPENVDRESIFLFRKAVDAFLHSLMKSDTDDELDETDGESDEPGAEEPYKDDDADKSDESPIIKIP